MSPDAIDFATWAMWALVILIPVVGIGAMWREYRKDHK